MEHHSEDKTALIAALDAADLRVLLMSVFHLTGDRKWLAPPYAPEPDMRLIADEDAGLPPEIGAEIRAEAARLIEAGAKPVLGDPGDDLTAEMMAVCLGRRTPPEYAPMMREEMGFVDRAALRPAPLPGAPLPGAPLPGAPLLGAPPDVLIIGAGASGLALAHTLDRLGVPFAILEEAEEVGGTWRRNRYPGCAVDTPNHAYSFSFGARNDWSRFFSPRDELFDYMRRIADEIGVRDRIRFRRHVRSAVWDEAAYRWRVEADGPDGPETFEAAALVSAIGPLSDAKIPAIDGMDRFEGPLFHTTDWPEDLDLTGKRVAIVGTGASGLQIAPAIADKAASLTIYQRTAQWVRHIPRFLDPMAPGARLLLSRLPYYAEWFRFTMLWRYGDGLLPTLRRDPDWPHPERAMNRINDRHRQEMEDHIRAELAGRPDLIATCIPDYPPFGKRILLDNGWYRTIRRDDVELVTDGVAGFAPDGIVASDGRRRDADVVVMATGFDVTRFAARLDVRGRGGRRLAEEWAEADPRAHLGITVAGFPNFFNMMGPNTGLAHGGSSIFQSECQSRYIARCLEWMADGRLAAIEPTEAAQDDYMARVDAEHRELVWAHPGVNTYYRNAKGRVVSIMPWRLVDYWEMTRAPDPAHYRTTPA